MSGEISAAARDAAASRVPMCFVRSLPPGRASKMSRNSCQGLDPPSMSGDISAAALDAASEAAKLSLRIGAAVLKASSFAQVFGEEFPAFQQAFVILKSITDKNEGAATNKQQLAGIQERCVDLTSLVIVKAQREPSFYLDTQPLIMCLQEANLFAEHWSYRNERDVAKLQRRLEELQQTLCRDVGDGGSNGAVEGVGVENNGQNTNGVHRERDSLPVSDGTVE